MQVIFFLLLFLTQACMHQKLETRIYKNKKSSEINSNLLPSDKNKRVSWKSLKIEEKKKFMDISIIFNKELSKYHKKKMPNEIEDWTKLSESDRVSYIDSLESDQERYKFVTMGKSSLAELEALQRLNNEDRDDKSDIYTFKDYQKDKNTLKQRILESNNTIDEKNKKIIDEKKDQKFMMRGSVVMGLISGLSIIGVMSPIAGGISGIIVSAVNTLKFYSDKNLISFVQDYENINHICKLITNINTDDFYVEEKKFNSFNSNKLKILQKEAKRLIKATRVMGHEKCWKT